VRQCIAAYGDAVLPALAEMIGRAMGELVETDGTVLDLFAGGAGGWSLGLHRAGYTTTAAVELDPWRRAVLAANFGGREAAAARLLPANDDGGEAAA
jgi:site-specific DNA-cytosine methylase